MGKKVLVDTSVWVEFLTRRHTTTSQGLRELLDQDAVCITGIIMSELLHGTRTEEESRMLLTKFQPLERLDIPWEAWIQAGVTAAQLRRRGLSVPLSDILIATVAGMHHCPIYTTDKHFALIPHVERYPRQ